MNTHELECLVRKTYYHEGEYAHFARVFSSDNIPHEFDAWPATLIANTDPADEPGEHWVAMYQHRQHAPIEFFDSYGNNPLDYDMHLPFDVDIINTHQLQHDASRACGHYCVYFVTLRPLASTAHSLIAYLRGNSRITPSERDEAAKDFVSHQLSRYPFTPICNPSHEHAQCCISKSVYSRKHALKQ